MATVRATFDTTETDGSKDTYEMVFGDSYKTWQMQLQEYIWSLRRQDIAFTIRGLCKSNAAFVQDGLKWCDAEKYQKELTREAKFYGKVVRRFETFSFNGIELPRSIEL